MQLTNVRTVVGRLVAGDGARGAQVRELTPAGVEAGLALDLWEIAPGGGGPDHHHPEEHQCYVLAGAGEYRGPAGAPVAPLREGAAFYVPAGERHQVVNTGATPLRVLVATPLAAERPAGAAAPPAPPAALAPLQVVFDGGSKGNPGAGYGSFVIMAPGRQPNLVQKEYPGRMTNNEAEYQTLLEALQYILATLEASGRDPKGYALDLRGDSELLIKQMKGEYQTKNATLRARGEAAHRLLRRFGQWHLTWHPREESVALLGH
ncbi:MAG TPA: cupin domain-containing protein [Chloroflexia bacterium]|nr:cupin domain-containing protein [Chloroflexia bacterium]